MQVNVAGIRRNIKNLAHNYSDAQVKVREATSNDPWGPSSTLMAEIADLTYNVVAFSEIMSMVWKRTNDHGKNWRHVYKALLLLEYLIKTGSEKVAMQCKENIYAIQTLKEFQYLEEGKDQGTHVREKAKQLVALLRDDERLKNERARSLKAKERFARTTNGFGSDGSIDDPSSRDRPQGWQDEPPRPVSDLEFVRPQTAGEEELQLQLAMAMSREEAEQEEAKRRSDDVRLQLALSQSEQDFKKQDRPMKKQESHLMDLLDISFGATSISSSSTSNEAAWGGLGATSSNQSDPWSGVPSKSNSASPALKANGAGWNVSGAPTNGNNGLSDPWLEKPVPQSSGDPWGAPKSADPWAPLSGHKEFGTRLSPVGAATSPSTDLDDFDIISNRSKGAMSSPAPTNNNNSNNLLEMDDLLMSTSKKPQAKTPQSFLGENSSLVNLDNLIKPATPATSSTAAAFNPFGDVTPQRNLFQQNQPPVPSINQLKQQQQTAFTSSLSQDPWAPVNSNANNSQNTNGSPPWMSAAPATGIQSPSKNPFLS